MKYTKYFVILNGVKNLRNMTEEEILPLPVQNDKKNRFYYKYTMIILFIFACLFTACTNESSHFGSPDPNLIFNEITLPDSYISNIFTYRDSVESYMQTRNFAARTFRLLLDYNHKLILGNYNNTDIRTLIRFDNVNADTSFVNDAIVTLFIRHIENPKNKQFTIKYAPMKKLFDNYATWEKFAEATVDRWEVEGGDFDKDDLREYSFSTVDSTGQNIDRLDITIDKDIMKEWLTAENSHNFGLIFIAENVHDTFIEFHSRNNGIAALQPQIKLTFEEEVERSFHASFTVFIHNYEENPDYLTDPLYISNIAPRSIFMELADLDSLYTLFPEANHPQDINRINILQANLILTVNQNNTLMTNQNIYLIPAIPNESFEIENTQDIVDYASWYFYPNERITTAYTEDTETMVFRITDPMRAFISEIRDNNGIGFINLQRNMDFSQINFFGRETKDNKKPKIVIKYSYLKE